MLNSKWNSCNICRRLFEKTLPRKAEKGDKILKWALKKIFALFNKNFIHFVNIFSTLQPFVVYLNKTSNLCRSYYCVDEQNKTAKCITTKQRKSNKWKTHAIHKSMHIGAFFHYCLNCSNMTCLFPPSEASPSVAHLLLQTQNAIRMEQWTKNTVEIVYLLLNVWFIALKRRNRNSVLYMENTFVQSV